MTYKIRFHSDLFIFFMLSPAVKAAPPLLQRDVFLLILSCNTMFSRVEIIDISDFFVLFQVGRLGLCKAGVKVACWMCDAVCGIH